MHKKAFTLIELIIVIVILGVLAALISANFISALQKGRDSKRKSDIRAIAQATELYYEENKLYPDTTLNAIIGNNGTGQLCAPAGCGIKVYMYKVPNDPSNSSGYKYVYQVDATRQHYQIYSTIENNQDQSPGVKQSGYTNAGVPILCGSQATQICKYGVSDPGSQP